MQTPRTTSTPRTRGQWNGAGGACFRGLMHLKSRQREASGQYTLPEVRAGLVLVKPRGCHNQHASRQRGRTWLLPLMRLALLAASMLCLTPTRGMGTGMSLMDAWSGAETEPQDARRSHSSGIPGGSTPEHVVFVGVPEEGAVVPLKALAQELLARGYRASLALPNGFQKWVEDIPGLAFMSLRASGATMDADPTSAPNLHPPSPSTDSTPQQLSPAHTSTPASPCPARPPGREKHSCRRQGLGDAWGGGVGGGWGAGLGLWRGMRDSLMGAREFLGHLKAYLGFYHDEEAVMYAPLFEALRGDPPDLVVADRRALAAFRVCSELGLRCVANSAGLLGDLDKPPNSVPAPYTGFPLEGLSIGQRLHSSLVRLVMALSRLQAARDADQEPAAGMARPFRWAWGRRGEASSSTVMALGNSCFGSLEYPRDLMARLHMVGPLWMHGAQSRGTGDADVLAPIEGGVRTPPSTTAEHGDVRLDPPTTAKDGKTGGQSVMEDVWAWLDQGVHEATEEDRGAPVVAVQLGYGGGKAWGVSPEAAVRRPGDNNSTGQVWEVFRQEAVTHLSAVGSRTLWLDAGQRHPDHVSRDPEPPVRSERPAQSSSGEVVKEHASPAEAEETVDERGDCEFGRRSSKDAWLSMVVDVSEACGGGAVGSCELLLRVMSHRSVTVLVTDGDLRSLQAALWHGKSAVVLPTSPDQREAAARLSHSGAGVVCSPPCAPSDLAAAVVDAHSPDMRRAALRAGAVLREAGGVFRAGNLLENELRTHRAATARRRGCPYGEAQSADDAGYPWCPSERWRAGWGEDRLEEGPTELFDERFAERFSLDPLEGLSWYPDDPEWIWNDMSWVQRHLVDVYAVYGALVMGVGLLMKLTWSLVWSLCDITTAPALSRGGGGGGDHSRSPSFSPSKDAKTKATNGGGNDGAAGKPGRSGTGKWGASSSSGGKQAKNGGNKHNHGTSNTSLVHHHARDPVRASVSGGRFSKKGSLTNGH